MRDVSFWSAYFRDKLLVMWIVKVKGKLEIFCIVVRGEISFGVIVEFWRVEGG